MDDTRRTELDDQAERDATERLDLLDLWVAKSFDIGDMPAKVKVGNQVISWGEEIFVPAASTRSTPSACPSTTRLAPS
jgi:hypothetical protein